ncbi:hypothetical protein Tco_1063292 [Tanacetum coccineum]
MKLQTDSLQQKLNDQIYENNKLRAQLKGKFSESQMNHNGKSVNTKLSKHSTSGTKLYSVTLFPKSKVIPKVVEKNDLSKSVTSHLTTNKIIEKCTKVLALGLLKIDSEPIHAYFKNNRAMHHDYLKVTKEHVATLQELLKEDRALKPLDEHIGHASKFAERIQELLVHFSASCPFTQSGNEKKRLKWIPTGRKTVPPSSSNDTSAIVVPPGHILTTTVIPVDIVEIVLWYLDSRCSKHMTGYHDKLINFVSKFIGMIRFGSDHFAAIMGYEDLQMGNILILRVYYVEGLDHNLFSVG